VRLRATSRARCLLDTAIFVPMRGAQRFGFGSKGRRVGMKRVLICPDNVRMV